MGIFDKFQHIVAGRQALEGASADPFNVVVERIDSATEAVVNGRNVVLAWGLRFIRSVSKRLARRSGVRAPEPLGRGLRTAPTPVIFSWSVR